MLLVNKLYFEKKCIYSSFYLFKNIKTENIFEDYISVVNVKPFSIALFRLCSSSLDLKVSEGKKLHYCIVPTVENEYHFCCISSFYLNLRQKLPYYYTGPVAYLPK